MPFSLSRSGVEQAEPISDPPAGTQAISKSQGGDTEVGGDVEKGNVKPPDQPQLDVEHLEVSDDPRVWTRARKNAILATVAFTAIGGTISTSIFFPALESLKADLKASNGLVSASVSLFILGQGFFPMFWSGISEIYGRKYCYISALVIYIAATVVCARANGIALFVVFRIVQALGSSAVIALGGGTLADIYEAEERGRKIGIFYGCPLLGPAIGPLIGGAVTTAGTWRNAFYFLIAYGGVCLGLAVWLPETFRKERSLAWRKAMKAARIHARQQRDKARQHLPESNTKEGMVQFSLPDSATQDQSRTIPPIKRALSRLSIRSGEDNVKVHFRDINPLAAIGDVLRQRHNYFVLIYSGFLFGSQYTLSLTASRSFAEDPYDLNALNVGLVLLSFGAGNFIGSVVGGRYSDHVFAKLKEKNGGVGEPEMRIQSTYLGLAVMPLFLIAYAWVVDKRVPLYWPTILLFPIGLSQIWIYSSTLAFVVDANPGMASSAVATNSLFRGVIAAAASQASQPIIDAISHGWFYTAFALILALLQILLVLVGIRGKRWREEESEKLREKKARKQIETS